MRPWNISWVQDIRIFCKNKGACQRRGHVHDTITLWVALYLRGEQIFRVVFDWQVGRNGGSGVVHMKTTMTMAVWLEQVAWLRSLKRVRPKLETATTCYPLPEDCHLSITEGLDTLNKRSNSDPINLATYSPLHPAFPRPVPCCIWCHWVWTESTNWFKIRTKKNHCKTEKWCIHLMRIRGVRTLCFLCWKHKGRDKEVKMKMISCSCLRRGGSWGRGEEGTNGEAAVVLQCSLEEWNLNASSDRGTPDQRSPRDKDASSAQIRGS